MCKAIKLHRCEVEKAQRMPHRQDQIKIPTYNMFKLPTL